MDKLTEEKSDSSLDVDYGACVCMRSEHDKVRFQMATDQSS